MAKRRKREVEECVAIDADWKSTETYVIQEKRSVAEREGRERSKGGREHDRKGGER